MKKIWVFTSHFFPKLFVKIAKKIVTRIVLQIYINLSIIEVVISKLFTYYYFYIKYITNVIIKMILFLREKRGIFLKKDILDELFMLFCKDIQCIITYLSKASISYHRGISCVQTKRLTFGFPHHICDCWIIKTITNDLFNRTLDDQQISQKFT